MENSIFFAQTTSIPALVDASRYFRRCCAHWKRLGHYLSDELRSVIAPIVVENVMGYGALGGCRCGIGLAPAKGVVWLHGSGYVVKVGVDRW